MALSDYTPVLSTITLPSGSTYYFKDAWAREQLEALVGYSKFLGVTTTELEDGVTTNPITIGGEQIDAASGDIVVYGSKEFIWNGSAWAEFGDLDAIKDLLGELAYVDEAVGEISIKPEGSITGTLDGTPKSVTVDGTASGDIDASFSGTAGEVIVNGQIASSEVVVGSTEGTATYRPAGTNSAPTFNGTEQTITINYKPDGTITAEFSGKEGEVSVSGIPKGVVEVAEVVKSLTGNYTPTGTIINTEITVTPATSSINTVTSAGTLPSLNGELLSVNVQSEDLQFSFVSSAFNPGTLPSLSSVSVLTGVAAAFTSTPEFVGDKVLISATFTGSSTTFSGSFTPSGSIVNGSFVGSSTTLSSTFTPAGSVTAPEFTGTATRLVGTVASASITASGTFTPSGNVTGTFEGLVEASGNYTPEGTISATFTGSSATIPVTVSASV